MYPSRTKVLAVAAGAALLGSFVLKWLWPPHAAHRSSCVCSKWVNNEVRNTQSWSKAPPEARRLLAKPSGLLTPAGMYRTLTGTGRSLEPVLIHKTEGN